MYARVCSRLMGFCVYTDSKSSVYIANTLSRPLVSLRRATSLLSSLRKPNSLHQMDIYYTPLAF